MKIALRVQTAGAVAVSALLALAACGPALPESSSSTIDPATTIASTDEPASSAALQVTTSTAAPTTSSSTIATTLVPDSVPATADELATELAAVEQALRGEADEYSDAQMAELGRYQQLLYRHLSFNPEWVETVLASVDDDVAPAVALNWEARENLQALLATHTIHDTLPAWRVQEPFPAANLLSYYKEAESLTGIDWEYVAAINLVETRMGRIQGVSTAGAIGPMQFLPTTWAECCEGDPTNPRDAIVGAATYLTHRGGPANMDKAIWGYNNSDYYVNAVKAYAEVLRTDERAYFGYHAWQVYFLTTEGVVLIAEGYEQDTEVPIAAWLAEHPETLISPSP